jgi:hypothetical protein
MVQGRVGMYMRLCFGKTFSAIRWAVERTAKIKGGQKKQRTE